MLNKVLNLTRPLICLDLETTGLSKVHDRIVQLALIKMYPDGEVTEWEKLINPDMLIPRESTQVHRITNAMVSQAPKFYQVAPVLIKGLKDCDFCGYNVDFDLKFLVYEFKRASYQLNRPELLFEPGRVVDAFKIFLEHNPRDLTAAVRHYLNEDMVDAHQAMPDTRATLRVLKAQLEQHPELPRSVEELHYRYNGTIPEGYLDPDRKLMWRDGVPVLTFGKQEYESIYKCSTKYLQWILREDFSKYVKDVVKRVLNKEKINREEYEKEMGLINEGEKE